MSHKWQKLLSTSPWVVLGLAFLAAAVLSIVIFPEFFITPHLEFCYNTFWTDYWGSFTLTNFFYQGGIQLWDPYDQLPLAYYCMTIGIFKFFNVMVAAIYVLFSQMSISQAEFFHQVFSGVFFLSNVFLKLTGAYLLFRKFASNRWIAVAGSIYFAVIATAMPFVTAGLSYGTYAPLLIYFTFNVFEYFRLRDILCWFLFFSILVADHPLHTLYLYQGIHFMVLACLVWAFLRVRRGQYQRLVVKQGQWMTIGLAAVASFLLILPVFYMLTGVMGDVDYSAHSRVSKIWDWHFYFTREMSIDTTSLTGFLASMAGHNGCWFGCGFVIFTLAMFGLIVSKDTRKYIVLSALVFMWMLNNPRDHFWGFIAHALNFLTNPVSFGVRIFHEFQLYFLPVWLFCLSVMGLEALRHASGKQWRVFGAVMIGVLLMAFPHLGAQERVYCLLQSLLMAWCVNGYFLKKMRFSAVALPLALLVMVEVGNMICFDRDHTLDPYLPRLHRIIGKPEAGLVGINFQNPRILPYREYFDLSVYDYDTNIFLSPQVQNVPGMFFRYTNLGRDLTPAWEFRPKHRSYSFWDSDGGKMAAYLAKDQRLIFSADYAINCSDEAFNAIVDGDQSRNVVSVCDDDGHLNLPNSVNITHEADEDRFQYSAVKFDSDQYLLKDGLVFAQILARPDLWPVNYATTFLTKDQDYIQFYIKDKDGLRRLKPAQGQIAAPDTFDFNNVRQGYFTVAFSPQEFPMNDAYVLTRTPRMEGIIKVTRWQSDNFGFDYRASRNRWLVFHYPYDRKWEISVDGQLVKFYRVNKSFIGLPLKRGEHHILLQYWPHSPLRAMLLISMVLATGLLLFLIHLALHDATPVLKPTT